jgi:hypothetical protein
MKEIHQLRHQLTAIVNMTFPDDTPLSMGTPMKPPDAKQVHSFFSLSPPPLSLLCWLNLNILCRKFICAKLLHWDI